MLVRQVSHFDVDSTVIAVADLEIFERGVQQVGWYIHSPPPKVVRRAAKRGKKILRVLFSGQEALS